jgi:hypothetical protein
MKYFISIIYELNLNIIKMIHLIKISKIFLLFTILI